MATDPPPPPLVSPDGRFYWDGHDWQPYPGKQVGTGFPARRTLKYVAIAAVALVAASFLIEPVANFVQRGMSQSRAPLADNGASSSVPSPSPTTTAPPSSARPSNAPTAASTVPPATVTVAQFGLRMTSPPSLGAFTYRIDHSGDGASTDLNGQQATQLGNIVLTTKAAEAASPQCAVDGEAAITVFSTSASQLEYASGPRAWKRVDSYLLGFTAGQYDCSGRGLTGQDIPRFQQLFQSAVPS